jgi:hypothetical protein
MEGDGDEHWLRLVWKGLVVTGRDSSVWQETTHDLARAHIVCEGVHHTES